METSPDALSSPDPGPSARIRALREISYGSLAGIISKVFEHPFDLCKVRLQSQVLDASARFNGPIDCLTQTWKNEGIRGLYRGLPAPIVGAMAENATLFFTYGELQRAIRSVRGVSPADRSLTIPELALAAAGAGAVTSFVLTPIELVKCKMQVQMLIPPSALSSTKPPGPLALVAQLVRAGGVRSLWLGQTGTFIREAGGAAAWFATKEAVASFLVSHRPPSPSPLSPTPTSTAVVLRPWESALSGACAGAAYNIALFPADTVKSAVQTAAELRPDAPPQAFVRTAREIWARQGLRGLYAGAGITIARSIPSSAIIFLVYDGLKARFG